MQREDRKISLVAKQALKFKGSHSHLRYVPLHPPNSEGMKNESNII